MKNVYTPPTRFTKAHISHRPELPLEPFRSIPFVFLCRVANKYAPGGGDSQRDFAWGVSFFTSTTPRRLFGATNKTSYFASHPPTRTSEMKPPFHNFLTNCDSHCDRQCFCFSPPPPLIIIPPPTPTLYSYRSRSHYAAITQVTRE